MAGAAVAPGDRLAFMRRRRDAMATMTVVKFPTAQGAEQMLATLERLQKERLITIQDAAIVAWPVGKRKPQTRQLHSMAGVGTLHGSFWGLLFGLLFFVPL